MDKQLRDLNRQLAPLGQRICSACGQQHPLTEEYWYFSRKGRDRTLLHPSSECKVCYRFRMAEKGRQRYRKDKAYREHKRRYWRAYIADPERREHHREHNRITIRVKRREAKRQIFAEKLGVKGGTR